MPASSHGLVWVCDFNGFSMQSVSLSMARAVIAVVGEHYPERLSLFLMVNAPFIFLPLWRTVKPIIDPNTANKACFLRSVDATRACLRELCHLEGAEWIMDELIANLQRPMSHAQSPAGWWCPPTECDAHDSRGFPSYTETYLCSERVVRGDFTCGHRLHPSIELAIGGDPLAPGPATPAVEAKVKGCCPRVK